MHQVAVILLCLAVFKITDTAELNDKHLHRYEPLNYNRHDLHARHQRSTEGRSLQFTLQAFGCSFPLRLKRDSSLFASPSAAATYQDIWYKGEVKDVKGSSVHGAIIHGMFRGTIRLPGETTYHVESSQRAFKNATSFHSIIYNEQDYHWGNSSFPVCGTSHKKQKVSSLLTGSESLDIVDHVAGSHYLKFSSEHREASHHVYHRKKRTTQDFSQRVCKLELTSDPVMWEYMKRKVKNEELARYEILYLFASHVQELNRIFGKTVFVSNSGDSSEQFSGIQFNIGKTHIMTEENCKDTNADPLCNQHLDSHTLLVNFVIHNTEGNYDNYDDYDPYAYDTSNDTYPDFSNSEGSDICLHFLFTARELEKSRLGLAYPAILDGSGGVCDKYGNNAGIVTLLFSNKELLPMVTKLVFTHEVGHSFGAEHDDTPGKCPDFIDDVDMNYYLMFSKAQFGTKPNNDVFSNCSRRYIGKILASKEHISCFTKAKESFCGNGIIEEGEECDCGFLRNCEDPCCVPRGAKPDYPEKECHLKAGSLCSPSQGPCCNDSCTFISQTERVQCKSETSCSDKAFCHGERYGAQCPPPAHRDDGTYCSNNGRICTDGKCTGSVCSLIGWTECQIVNMAEKLSVTDKEELCYMSCKKNKTSECVSTHNYDVHKYPEFHHLLTQFITQQNLTSVDIRLPIGYPCNRMQGYCDVFHRCRGVEPDTPLARLKRLLFSKEFKMEFTGALKQYWWAVILCVLVLGLFMSFFIYCCAIHTPSNNPDMKPARPVSETIRRLSFRRSANIRESTVVNPDEDIPLKMKRNA